MKLVLLWLAAVSAGPVTTSLTLIDDGLVEFEISNSGSEAFHFPTWFTPFDETTPLANLQFEPEDSAVYMGFLAKRLPSSEPVLVIEAQSSIKKTFRPQSQWSVVSNQSYTLSWPGREGLDLAPARVLFQVSATANTKWIPQNESDVEENMLGYTFANCGTAGSAKVVNVQNAVSKAMAANTRSYNCLNGNSCGATYATWYGAQTAARLSSITGKHSKIQTAFTGAWVAYCDGPECSPNIYAYVFPNDAKRNIYMCSLFYNNKDVKELVNTPVHEMSHFSSVAATKDLKYGEANCKALAKSNPDQAITNADNLGYFAYYMS